mmetsp:Transcript_27272/g.85611  ORF Transcript_27272/g.85611 Transcript_27272/m.85611 type:complete len:330 (+) Transcript_27272:54-1043(+)
MQREIFFFPLRSAPRAWRRSKTRRPRSGGAACRGRPSAGGSRGGAAPPTAARGRGSPRRLRRRAAWRPRRRGGPPRNRSPRCRALRRANPCPPRPRRQRRRRACCARRKPCSRALLCTALHVYGQHVQDMSRACGGWCLSPALRRAPLSLRGDGSLAAVYGDDSLVAALGVELRREGRSAAPKLEQRTAARQRRRQQRPHLIVLRQPIGRRVLPRRSIRLFPRRHRGEIVWPRQGGAGGKAPPSSPPSSRARPRRAVQRPRVAAASQEADPLHCGSLCRCGCLCRRPASLEQRLREPHAEPKLQRPERARPDDVDRLGEGGGEHRAGHA